jgi:F-type H+-transporting ATPase subunit b
MHAGSRKKVSKSKFFGPFAGTALFFAWLGNALASEAEAAHHHLNWTDFGYRTLAFVIVVGVLVKLLKKPVANFLNSRREEIQRLLAELEAKTAEAKSEHEAVQAKLSSLESETKKIIDELIAEGELEKERIIKAAHREAEYIQQQAQIAIEQEIQAARDSLKEEVADWSIAAAQDLIGKKIKTEDQQRLVKEFLTKVVEAK